MKLNRTDAAALTAIALGAFTAAGLTGLAVEDGHRHHEVHVEYADDAEVAARVEIDKEVRVRIRHGAAADEAAELPAEVPSAESAEGVVRIDGDVRVIRADGSTASSGPQPLLYVDGVRVEGDRESVLADIDPDRIDRVEVVKGEAAMRLFGEEATGGVIQIFLKDIGAAHPGG